MKADKVIRFFDIAKNVVVAIGVPVMGVYVWKYHNDQMNLKDSLIAVQNEQIKIANAFSVESSNSRLQALMEYYKTMLASSDDSINVKQALLDSMASSFKLDSLHRFKLVDDRVIIYYDDLRLASRYRRKADSLVHACRQVNDSLQRVIEECKGRK